jgi:lysophospholipid acyltransferase (LPLAT)-like uncharacterized protein
MAILKRLFGGDSRRCTAAFLGAWYIRLVDRTTRWSVERPPETRKLEAEGQPAIVCFWHGRLLMMGSAWQRAPRSFQMLISSHRDGALISRTIAHLGFATLAGSPKRGGMAALRSMQRLLAEGVSVGVTPDGPRGPRMRAKPGAIKAAQWSGAPLLPVTYAVSRRRMLDSWDRFCLALPFSRGVILWGAPIAVPRHVDAAELERLRRRLEDRLNDLTAEADRRCGHPATEPAREDGRLADASAAGGG